MKRILEGLTILAKYEPDGQACAEHDELFACGVGPEAMSEEDRAALKRLGWRWDGDLPSWIIFT